MKLTISYLMNASFARIIDTDMQFEFAKIS